MVNESKMDIANIPYGCICSEATFKLLKKHFEGVSNKSITNIATVYGIKVRVEKLFPDETCWVLNEQIMKKLRRMDYQHYYTKCFFLKRTNCVQI